jgi:hypothetical protein
MSRGIVATVERGFCHSRSVRSLSRSQRVKARVAELAGYLRCLPKRGRFPRRYVVTANGSHLLGTFDFDTLHQEKRARMAA